MKKRSFGALSPLGEEWQLGKTAGSIVFVQDALSYIETCSNDEDRERLMDYVEKIKRGEVVLTEELDPGDFLTQK